MRASRRSAPDPRHPVLPFDAQDMHALHIHQPALVPESGLQSVRDLKERFGLDCLREEGVRFAQGQVDFVAAFLADGGNFVVQAPTSSGKTWIALMAASRFISQGLPVLFLTPQELLVSQICTDALEVLEIGLHQIGRLTGHMHHDKRAQLYKGGSGIVLFIATPETVRNDIEAGRLVPGPFNFPLAIFDEVHKARGKYAYTSVAASLGSANCRILGLSASPGEDDLRLEDLKDIFHVPRENFVHLNLPRLPKYERLFPVTLGEDLDRVRKTLLEVALDFVGDMEHLLVQAGAGDGTCSEFRDTVDPIRDKTGFPSERKLHALRAGLQNAAGSSSNPTFYTAFSKACALGELKHLELLISTCGPYAFLRHCAERFIKISPLHGESPARFDEEVFGDARIRAIFDSFAVGSIFALLRDIRASGWEEFFQTHFPEEPMPKRESSIRKRVLDLAEEVYADLAFQDPSRLHPKESQLIEVMKTFNEKAKPDEKILILAEPVAEASFLARLITLHAESLPRVGPVTWIGGKEHLTHRERERRLSDFREGKSTALVSTRVSEEGLHIPDARYLLVYTPASRPERNEQREGRVGRDGKGGFIWHILAEGTMDMATHFAGVANTRKMRRL